MIVQRRCTPCCWSVVIDNFKEIGSSSSPSSPRFASLPVIAVTDSELQSGGYWRKTSTWKARSGVSKVMGVLAPHLRPIILAPAAG